MKKIFFIFLALFLFLITSNPSYAEKFYIKNYRVFVDVQENGSFKVSENIDAIFTQRAHGIVRTIPKKGDYIKNIKATKLNRKVITQDYINLYLGDSYYEIEGEQIYNISYVVAPKEKENEFYFNVIGTEWNTNIDKLTFEIKMPKSFNKDKVYFYAGKYGSETNEGYINYQVEGNTIKGRLLKPLDKNEGVTVIIPLPDGYYDYKMNFSELAICVILIAFFTLIVFIYWLKNGKDDHITPVVTFEPPKNIDVLDADVLLKRNADSDSFVAYIIELASKNYIEIDEKDNSFTLIKKEENLQNLSKREKIAIKHIFQDKNEVTKEELETSKNFYQDVQDFIDEINLSKTKIYEKSSINANAYVCLTILSVAVLFLSSYIISNFDIDGAIFNTLIMGAPIVAFFLFKAFFAANKGILSIIIFAYVVVSWLVVVGMSLSHTALSAPKENLYSFGFGILSAIACVACVYQLPKRNKFGNKILGELMGLKHFIKTTEANRIDKMISDNPAYFYNILPYAYILGVSDVWIKQFEDILIRHPEYKGSYITVHSFNNFTNSMKSCSVPTTINGGISHSSSSIGGGFSGGGHGGGGGHSW